MSYTRLEDGRLRGPDNVIFRWDENDPRFAGFISWLEAGGTLTKDTSEPEQVVPAEIQMWQARAVLIRMGLINQVNAAVEASNNLEIKNAWEYAPNVVRKSAFVTALSAPLGLTESMLDQLFIEGAKIK